MYLEAHWKIQGGQLRNSTEVSKGKEIAIMDGVYVSMGLFFAFWGVLFCFLICMFLVMSNQKISHFSKTAWSTEP